MAVIHENTEQSIRGKINKIEEQASYRNRKLYVQLGILTFLLLLFHLYPGGLVEFGSAVCEWMQNTCHMYFIAVYVMMGIWICGYLLIPMGIIRLFFKLLRDPKTYKEKNEVEILQSGLEGETKALNALSTLPDNYHLFTNSIINYAGSKSETDIITVGPTGIFIIEVKNYKGELRGDCTNNRLIHVKTGGDRESVYNPLKQVSTHVYRLANILREKGINCWVDGIVFFADEDLSTHINGSEEQKKMYIHSTSELIRSIIQKDKNISSNTISDIVECIEQM